MGVEFNWVLSNGFGVPKEVSRNQITYLLLEWFGIYIEDLVCRIDSGIELLHAIYRSLDYIVFMNHDIRLVQTLIPPFPPLFALKKYGI